MQAMNALEKELHETRATGAEAQQAAQLKTTGLEASSQVSKDLQEQLSRLTTEKVAMEQRLQAKTAEVVSLHDKATTSEQQSCDLKTKNSRLEQEVNHLTIGGRRTAQQQDVPGKPCVEACICKYV